jgi:hypothetical protein
MSAGAQPVGQIQQAQQPAAVHGPAIARMYARWTLDCVIESALAVANDYVKRYRQYSRVSAEAARVLADLRTRTGSDPSFPSADQRAGIYGPLIGGSDAKNPTANTNFQNLAGAVRAAAIAYSERAVDSGEPMLRQAFVDAARNFKVCLSSLTGGVVELGESETANIFESSVRILSNDAVARAFGLPPAPASPWPLNGQLDGDGAYLIEAITGALQPSTVGTVPQGQFLTLQQVAASGAQLISHLVQSDLQDDLAQLITEAYSWATALARSASPAPNTQAPNSTKGS